LVLQGIKKKSFDRLHNYKSAWVVELLVSFGHYGLLPTAQLGNLRFS